MSEEMLTPSLTESESIVSAADGSTLSAASGMVPPVVLSVGQQLRDAREAKGMSAADVAKALKLSAHQVVALEEDDWSNLPETIIRGFVRNYARLLKLDAEPLMHALTTMQMPQAPVLEFPTESQAALSETNRVARHDYTAVFSGLALLLVAVLAYFFVPQDFWQSKLAAITSGEKSVAVSSEKNGASTLSALPVPSSLPPENAPVTPVVAADASAQPQSAPQAASNMSSGQTSSGLKLSFAQPSWVEIRDRSGQIIFSQLNPAGSQRDIEGQAPFALVIGNATNVTVQYKGKVVELSQRSKDDVARLNLD